jgi:hypothetical protein
MHIPAVPDRQTGSPLNRRFTLHGIGVGAFAVIAAAVARASPVHAGKDARKARKRSRKKCKRQIDPCRASVTRLCADAGCDEESLAGFLSCCQHLSDCRANASLDCFFSRVS